MLSFLPKAREVLGSESPRVHLGSRWCGGGIDPLYAPPERATDRPVIGILGRTTAEEYAFLIAAFRKSVTEAGYVEGQNVTIEYRWADNQADRLEAMASELVKKQVSVIFTSGGALPALAARAATSTRRVGRMLRASFISWSVV